MPLTGFGGYYEEYPDSSDTPLVEGGVLQAIIEYLKSIVANDNRPT